jgi:type II secretory pathway component GspD/PulD (secretin)
MTLYPSVTEFVGYDANESGFPTGNGNVVKGPLPHFRMRQASTKVSVTDGQTVVIGGMPWSDDIFEPGEKAQSAGGAEVAGGTFRKKTAGTTSETNPTIKTDVLIFITPTIVNPDGTRVHTEEEMPFSKAATPKVKN